MKTESQYLGVANYSQLICEFDEDDLIDQLIRSCPVKIYLEICGWLHFAYAMQETEF